MIPARPLHRLSRSERLNFLLTNRIPRRWATLFMGRFSRVRQPVVRAVSMRLWQAFAGNLHLEEARKTRFESMHDCFIRELKPGMRPVDPDPQAMVSPCDAIVGASGTVRGGEVIQAKGYPYELAELLGDQALADSYRDGTFVTLRITASMYHRFHAPDDLRLNSVRYHSGDTWNVNPVALKRVERLFCRNERAVLEMTHEPSGARFLMVPVAAILVASIRLHALHDTLDLRYRGPVFQRCDARYARGEEMGYFQQGSTILMFTGPEYRVHPDRHDGERIRVGQPLLARRNH
ncbi:phosphatidylserine decarboxylase [Tamilnaduibacter salinus]|uniref:phosphatidylserine decarboxylase n=1 Tax=Tamilnaduibacter salinus TaxID=1484056 RepID=A0A2U1D0Z1_9GAMM|nr:archaetidylserine decarboxylase [Tamilnaduibacter salinus]PVY79052.1 phosphatidylserine decarboxylase [Tamilnaduibacter salinus]